MKRLFLNLIVLLCMMQVGNAANYYWVGGSGNWSDVSHWATTSGGSVLHTTPPTSNDDVFFDSNSFTTIGVSESVLLDNANQYCRNFTFSSAGNADDVTFGYTAPLSGFFARNLIVAGHVSIGGPLLVASPNGPVFVRWIFEGTAHNPVSINSSISNLKNIVLDNSSVSLGSYLIYGMHSDWVDIRKGNIEIYPGGGFYGATTELSGSGSINITGTTDAYIQCSTFLLTNTSFNGTIPVSVSTGDLQINRSSNLSVTFTYLKLNTIPHIININPLQTGTVMCNYLEIGTIITPSVYNADINGDLTVTDNLFFGGGTPTLFNRVDITDANITYTGTPEFSTHHFTIDNATPGTAKGKIIRPFDILCAEGIHFNNITGQGNIYLKPSCTVSGTSLGLILGTSLICPTLPTVSGTVTHPVCTANSGSINATVAGGTPPYFYQWYNGFGVPLGGSMGPIRTNLSAGSYRVEAVDANGLISETYTFTLTAPAAFNEVTTPTDPLTVCLNNTVSIPLTATVNNIAQVEVAVEGLSTTTYTLPAPSLNYTYDFTPMAPYVPSRIINFLVTDVNGCMFNFSRTVSIAFCLASPSTPSSPSGNTSAACEGSTQQYTVVQGSNVEYYVWTPPSGATINGLTTGNSVSITLPQNFTSGTLKVRACNYLGCSTERVRTIYSKPLSTGIITGSVTGVCGSSTQTYSTTPATGATSYKWFVPSGAQILSGQGTTSISVSFPQGFISGNISVHGSNVCGNGPVRSLAIRSVPAKPGTITGKANDLCQNTNVIYSIANTSGATGYLWSVPPFATIISGQGTNSITVNYPKFYSTSVISVTTLNNCGSSEVRSLGISPVITLAANAINGPSMACANQNGLVFSTPVVSSATYYDWALPPGAVITSGITTNNITANWSTVFSNMTLRVQNACGTSNRVFKSVVETGCRTSGVNDTLNNNVRISIYPNPATSMVNIKTNNANDENMQVQLMNSLGQCVLKLSSLENTIELNTLNLPRGIYYLNITTPSMNKAEKLILQ